MLSLEYDQHVFVDDDEPSRFVTHVKGLIHELADDDESIVLGEFSVILVDVEAAVTEDESVFDVFDSDSRTIDYYGLYLGSLEFKSKVVRAIGGSPRWAPNLLILDRLAVLPEHRGSNIGLRVLRCLRVRFSSMCGLIVMKPFPLQFEGGIPAENAEKEKFRKLRLDQFPADFDKSLRKLRAYYRRLGFARVPGTDYMAADPEQRAPSLKEMGITR